MLLVYILYKTTTTQPLRMREIGIKQISEKNECFSYWCSRYLYKIWINILKKYTHLSSTARTRLKSQRHMHIQCGYDIMIIIIL